MRSYVICALLLAFAAASAQAGAVSRRTELQYSCDIEGIASLAKDLVVDSIAVVLDVRGDLSGIYSGVLGCVSKDLTKPEKLVGCVVSSVKSEVRAAFSDVEQYIADLRSTVQQLKTKVSQCAKL